MKFLHTAFQNMKKPFEKGGKFEKYNKVIHGIDAFETLMFTPDEVTHSGSHIRDGIDLKRTMSIVILAMIPCLLFGMYNAGYQHFRALGDAALAAASFWDMFQIGLIKVLPLVVVSYGVGLGIEFAFAMLKGHSIEEGYLVTGMLIPLIVPIDIPLWMLAVAVAFAVVFGKEVFGGTGMNILNVALTARAFLFFAYPTFMSGDKIWVHEGMTNDAISGATILGDLAAMKGGLETLRFSAQEMFIGLIPGSVGETSTLAVLIGAGILLLTGIASWRIMLSAVIGGGAMGLIFNFFGANGLMEFPWWQHMLVGGFAFGVVFMATDPVTAAQTNKGKWIYGFLIGFMAIMIRVFNPAYPEGIMLAILFMNVMAPLIDHYVVEGNIKKRLKRSTVKTA
ncbi:MAG: NADH:ubiquinone reductase (Na(+)-transporting) subunit B [Flavobacteriales bacterium]|nr:NADH:ubiquinone reductase (Na(+)-transporting) subunit B [Flavobacteriales bacterium]